MLTRKAWTHDHADGAGTTKCRRAAGTAAARAAEAKAQKELDERTGDVEVVVGPDGEAKVAPTVSSIAELLRGLKAEDGTPAADMLYEDECFHCGHPWTEVARDKVAAGDAFVRDGDVPLFVLVR